MGHPAQPDALVGHHAEKDGESKAISAWKKRQMRVCLFFHIKGSPFGGNGDDRRQRRKQGGAVGAAASKTQAERGGCWEPQPGLGERSETERLYEGEPFLCRKVRLLAFSVSFWRKEWYNGFAVHPAYLTGEEVDALAYFLTFLVSVGADVVSHFICKWLDRYEENRKA